MRRRWERQALPAMLCALLALAGCGGGGSDEPSAGAAGADSQKTATAAATSPAPAATAAPAGSAAATAPAAVGARGADPQAALTAAAARADAQQRNAAAAVARESADRTAALTPDERAAVAVAVAQSAAPQPAMHAQSATQAALADGGSTATTPVVSGFTVRARGTMVANVGPMMQVRVNGTTIGTVEVRAVSYADYNFPVTLKAGDKVDVVFTNDAYAAPEDRNLFVGTLASGTQAYLPSLAGAIVDWGSGAAAFDGQNTVPGRGDLYSNGALRLTWPAAAVLNPTALARKVNAVRLLQQASFGANDALISDAVTRGSAGWIASQQRLALAPDFVNAVQAKFALGDSYRPNGSSYTPDWVNNKFWQTAGKAPDQLRKRVAFALHEIFMASLADSNLYGQARAYANYVDLLNKGAFGNFRTLMEDMALTPAMGIYLSHMRNQKENPATNRMPDENFGRELMQLFTIGLYELNADGTPKLDGGKPIETYTNDDVMAMAKVFTGWSWAFPDGQLTDSNFQWGWPDLSVAGDTGIDLLPMKPYPQFHSTAQKVLFAGKPWAVTIPANGTAKSDLKTALDTLFNHPNVGPFVGRQLIQHLVSSNPSPAYVARVAAAFANNGSGVRGDMAAVVRAVLLDTEARNGPAAGALKLREPVLRVAQWMRGVNATSATGEYLMAWELQDLSERALAAPSVFGYFRPGYVLPNSAFSASGATTPEFQIFNESTSAGWINLAEQVAGWGIGWTGSAADVTGDYATLGNRIAGGDLTAFGDYLDLTFLGGRMSPTLRSGIFDAVAAASDGDAAALNIDRARAAVFLLLASPEYAVQP